MNGMTISLVGQNNNIIVMDSHLHGQLGAMVGIISIDKIEQILIYVKQQLSPHFNICSLTFVSYQRGSIMADMSNKLIVSVCGKEKNIFASKS